LAEFYLFVIVFLLNLWLFKGLMIVWYSCWWNHLLGLFVDLTVLDNRTNRNMWIWLRILIEFLLSQYLAMLLSQFVFLNDFVLLNSLFRLLFFCFLIWIKIIFLFLIVIFQNLIPLKIRFFLFITHVLPFGWSSLGNLHKIQSWILS
jgi:hypothetical protein